ncbi:TPA: helix-turn-helix domain-containing protein, partial [Klebsiella pneumoniae]|nr:helix-turn-helix domain-containing protein [Klebsiella pneumoniae]HBX7806549.1 helix-turn-helix domain-containing protein [Klebsiella pneumoniae]
MTTMPQRESTIAVPDDRRKQLGAFLRARRESLDPQRLGLPRVGRRRTPGLRREEVAMLADVGVTWYTWLEQGREVNPSEAVLVGVANALQCSPLETRHLFVLAGLTPPEATQVTVCEGISPGTRRMLDSLMPQPASIQKPNFDIVAWNDSFCRLMGIDFATLPEEDRNCIYLYLTHETWRSRIENRDVLPTFVSYFRAAMAEHRGDPAWENKLARFFAASSEFEALWHQRYEVRGVENQIKHFNHPQLGRFSLQQMYWYSAPR